MEIFASKFQSTQILTCEIALQPNVAFSVFLLHMALNQVKENVLFHTYYRLIFPKIILLTFH